MLDIENRPQFDQNWTFTTGATAVDAPGPYVRAFDYPAGYRGNFHRHRLRQIVYPVRGVATVDTDTRHVTIAPYRAFAIESWVSHSVSAIGNASLRSIFLDPEEQPLPGAQGGVFGVSPLLHELIREAGNHYGDIPAGSLRDRILKLIEMLVFQTQAVTGYLELPRITHPRLAQPFEGLFDVDPFPDLRAEQCAAMAALSPRQFRRLFKRHTGMSFKDWRALARVRKAAEKIAGGELMANVAADLSMSSSSALGQVFKRYTGLTPTEFARLNNAAR